ncbi:MAG: hypothetical protein FJX65_01450 [Alphaproteobacteria bacterium]|nr:hypothetical protein [Alphaproteobacteria bacterium]
MLRRVLAVVAALAVVAGCSSIRLAYNYADDYVYHTLDQAFGLDDTQQTRVSASLRDVHAWHRSTQLDLYRESLVLARDRLAGDPTPADVEEFLARVRSHTRVLTEQAARPLAQLLISLRPEQLTRIEEQFARDADRFVREARKETHEDRLKRRVGRVEESYRFWLGRLSEAQLARVRTLWQDRTNHHETAYAERQARQAVMLTLVRDLATTQPPIEEAEQRVKATAILLEASQDPTRRAYFEKLGEDSARMISDVLVLRSEAQRRALDRRLAGLAEDLVALANRGRPGQAVAAEAEPKR